MPHSIDIDGISESLFLLQNLVHASSAFCARHKIRYGAQPTGDFDWDYYFGWLKPVACENLIQVSIRMRMLEDILRGNDYQLDFSALDADARKGLDLGRLDEGSDTLTVRECWNKIIHATDVQFDWDERGDHEVWTGDIWLFGKKGKDDWKLQLKVEAFATATSRYLGQLECSVDWYHLYKHDH